MTFNEVTKQYSVLARVVLLDNRTTA